MDFTEWISDKIKERGLSVRGFARNSGLSHQGISDVLRGKYPPTYEFCIAIANGLGESPAVVLDLAGLLPKPPEWEWTPELIEWSQLFDQMSEEDRAEMLQMGRFKVGKERARRKVKA